MSNFIEPILSACIVLHHSGTQALQTVLSFQESDLPLELHVVDHSPGSTLNLHMRWQCPGIQYYAQEKNPGFAVGHNVPLPYLRSKYHLICHPDVTFDDTLLTRMVTFMEENPGCVILSPRFVNDKGEEQFMPRFDPRLRYLLGSAMARLGGPFKRWHARYTLAGQTPEGPVAVENASGCFLLIRTGLLWQLQGLCPEYFLAHSDSDLCRRARDYGDVVYHPQMVVTHHRQAKGRRLKLSLRRIRDTLRYLRKWRSAGRKARK